MANPLCLMCGSRAASLEHVWPSWLAKVFPAGVPPLRASAHFSMRTGIAGDLRQWPSKAALDEKARVVCDPCNTGWMSRLETAAQPLLTGLWEDTDARRVLTGDEQKVLARWATKTAMMLQALRPENRVATPEQHQELRVREEPPAGAIVWIAHFDPPTLGGYHFPGVDKPSPAVPTPTEITYGLTTLVVHNVLLQVEMTNEIVVDRAPVWQRAPFPRIWPVTSDLAWPPSPTVPAADLGWYIGGPSGLYIDPYFARRLSEDRAAGPSLRGSAGGINEEAPQ